MNNLITCFLIHHTAGKNMKEKLIQRQRKGIRCGTSKNNRWFSVLFDAHDIQDEKDRVRYKISGPWSVYQVAVVITVALVVILLNGLFG
jgi:hypothetical protein